LFSNVAFLNYSQGVAINALVYYGFIKDVFNSDIGKDGDYKLLASRLQNFLICIEMFLAALAHQYSFPYSTFQINDLSTEGNWFRTFLAMLDMEDVRQDLSEHFGVVGGRITRGFRSQPTYMSYSESDYLIQSQHDTARVIAATRVKDRPGTYGSTEKQQKLATASGSDKRYRIANIEDKESPKDEGRSSSSKATTQMTQSTASSSSSYGINVRGLENDPINYRNPEDA